ncbi:hypothetical protein L208DRAFT_1382539 [Tricholoma matsutake]|nr:hypothetical protein L208DRAFT_1382539 [Tricholoma matsutake 945]
MAKRWKVFKHCLCSLSLKLARHIQELDLTIIISEPVKPLVYSYFHSQPSEEEMIKVCGLSRLHLIAFAAGGSSTKTPVNCQCLTLSEVVEDANAHMSKLVLKDLELCSMWNRDEQRKGVVIEVGNFPWLAYFFSFNLPFWLHWSSPPFVHPPNSWVLSFLPLEVLPDDLNAPRPEPYTEISVRKNRQKEWASKCKPGKKGPAVFMWELVDGYRIWKNVTHKEVPTTWDIYSHPRFGTTLSITSSIAVLSLKMKMESMIRTVMRIVMISRMRIPGGSHLHVYNLVHQPMFPNAPTLTIVHMSLHPRVQSIPNPLHQFHNTPTLTIMCMLINPWVQCLPDLVHWFHNTPKLRTVCMLINSWVLHLPNLVLWFNNTPTLTIVCLLINLAPQPMGPASVSPPLPVQQPLIHVSPLQVPSTTSPSLAPPMLCQGPPYSTSLKDIATSNNVEMADSTNVPPCRETPPITLMSTPCPPDFLPMVEPAASSSTQTVDGCHPLHQELVQHNDGPKRRSQAPLTSVQGCPGPSSLPPDAMQVDTSPMVAGSSNSSKDIVEDLLYHCFGFMIGSAIAHPTALAGRFTNGLNTWKVACCAVGAQELHSINEHHSMMMDFLHAIIGSERPLDDILASYWDLHPQNPDHLSDYNMALHVSWKTSNMQTLYILRLLSDEDALNRTWLIAVDAAMVLECIHQGLGPTVADIALYFIKNGIPFVTLQPKLPVYQLFPPLPTQLDLTLGRRNFHHTFTLLEFQDYEQRHNEFFIKYLHAHRALRMGGVVAQLALAELLWMISSQRLKLTLFWGATL